MKNLLITVFAVLFATLMGMFNQLYILSGEEQAGYLYCAAFCAAITIILIIYMLAEWMSKRK